MMVNNDRWIIGDDHGVVHDNARVLAYSIGKLIIHKWDGINLTAPKV